MIRNNKSVYITSKEAAKILGFSADYVRKLIADRILIAEKLGRNWIMKKNQLKNIKRKRFPRE